MSGARSLRVVILALATLVVLLAVTGPALADDTEPPEWGNATKAGATTIDVTVYDDGTLDISSIDRDDFVLTAGKVENISVEQIDESGNRTGARISLALENRVNENNVTVGLRSGATISDSVGNQLTNGTVTVSGMDTVTPRYRGYGLRRINSSTVEIRAETNEPLSGLRLSVGGPQTDELSRANFTESTGDTVLYTARYTAPEEGEYSFLWMAATDRYNNTSILARRKQFRYDGSSPNVTLEGPDNATVGEPVNFTAKNSSDDQEIDQFQWRIDDGTIIPGESIRVAFPTPGIHEVSVDVTDPYGNTGTETRRVSVGPAQGSVDGVTVTRSTDTEVSATVEGTGMTQLLRGSNGTLVRGTNASLDRLTASFPANQTADLTVRARNETPSSFTAGTGLATFTVDHGETPVDRVTFWFSVERATLDRAGIEPAELSLYRDEDGWTPLDTSVIGGGDRVVYRASSPGFSAFVVGGDPSVDDGSETDGDESQPVEQTGTADIAVSNVTVEPDSLSAGDQAVLTVTLDNAGTATGDYLVTVFLNDSELATREVTVPAGQTRTTEFARELPEGGPLEVGSQRVANVSRAGGGSGGMLSGLPSLPALPSLPNPLALWPGGIVGTVLGAVIGGVVVIYGVLKGLAIYLGY